MPSALTSPARRAMRAKTLRMTEQEYLDWADEDTRAEWVNGEVTLMSPDNVVHTRVGGFLYVLLHEFVSEHPTGEAFGPNFAMRFGSPVRRRIPDVFYVAKSRIHLVGETCFDGLPDLVVEVVSPDSVSRDYQVKFVEYQEHGVREYWLVDPRWKRVRLNVLRRGKYKEAPEKDGKLHSTVLRGFFLRSAWLWQEPFPPLRGIRKELKID
jgi:Uma2 family endonuclease